MKKRAMGLVIAGLVTLIAHTQTINTGLQQFLNNSSRLPQLQLMRPAQVKEFYRLYHYNMVWVNNAWYRQQLIQYIRHSAELGLKEETYQYAFIKSYNSGLYSPTASDSLAADIRFTDAALQFFHDVAFGKQPGYLGYNGLNYSPGCISIASLLAVSLTANRFSHFLEDIELKTPDYRAVKNKLNGFIDRTRDTLYQKTVVITSGKVSIANKPLLQKLFQLQLVNSPEKKITVKELKDKVREAQQLFSLQEDGLLHQALIKELNIPLPVRIEELGRALNDLRWLRCIRQQQPGVIIANIPSATLMVYSADTVNMESKIIVGKRSTRTPTVCSEVTAVVLYPYWVVPKKIATKELLPLIRKDIGYLEINNLLVINDRGRIVDPATINWHLLSTSHFPYTLRQATGCDNSLGIVKLDFYSPFGVYLHDTPWKVLFSMNKRYFSHGCMRVEKAVELARYALQGNTVAIDTITEKGCLYNQKPIPVPVAVEIPVFVLYNTAWVDSSATVRFYEDVYTKFPRLKK